VVVDPVARVLTHLVVEPKHRSGLGKLVPLDLVDATTGEVRLACTLAQFDKLEPAEETQFLPGTGGYPGYEPGHVVTGHTSGWRNYARRHGPRRREHVPPIPLTSCPSARWPCAAASTSTPATATSAGSKGSSSTATTE